MAEEAVDGRPGDLHLVRGAADVVASREHLHRLRGHPQAAARGLEALRRHRQRLQGTRQRLSEAITTVNVLSLMLKQCPLPKNDGHFFATFEQLYC